MLWSLQLPFMITFYSLLGIVILVTLCAPLMRVKRTSTFAIFAGLAMVAFIPSCAGIMSILDRSRFGVFEYTTAADAADGHVERYLPPEATDITIEKTPLGYRAKFRIPEDTAIAQEAGTIAASSETKPAARVLPMDADSFNLRFEGMDWQFPPDLVHGESSVADNGAGHQLYHSISTGWSYQTAGYW